MELPSFACKLEARQGFDIAYCLHVNLGVSSGGGVNKVPGSRRGDMGREGKVILMPSPYYCYIVTSETAVWWVGVMPLGCSQAHRGVTAHTHTH